MYNILENTFNNIKIVDLKKNYKKILLDNNIEKIKEIRFAELCIKYVREILHSVHDIMLDVKKQLFKKNL